MCSCRRPSPRWLTAQGHTAEHVIDRHLETAPDTAIWDYAVAASAVIITRDEDFAQRKVLDAGGPQVIWIRLSNPRRRAVLAAFETLLPDLLSALDRGEMLIEVV